MLLINNIEELRQYAKLNASTDWNTFKPFVLDAQERYIVPYFGNDLLEAIAAQEDDALRKRICRALGPFSLALATDELSINFGETGHTVTRTDHLAPASDAKIAKATESLLQRAWHNLDRALQYLMLHTKDYTEWDANAVERKLSTKLFDNHSLFQDMGMIDINYSPLTFSRLRSLIMRIEQTETLMYLPSGYDYSNKENNILQLMQAYTGSRVAELLTNTKEAGNSLKNHPPIQFIVESPNNSANYYATQATFWRNKIQDLLIAENSVDDSRKLKVNAQDNTIFFAGGSRVDN